MPSRLMKKTSLIMVFTLGTMIASESVVWADPQHVEDGAALLASITPTDSAPPSVLPDVTTNTVKGDVGGSPLFTPMSDEAAQGMGCFVATASSLALAYAIGPTELMMLVTGAVIVPSSSSLLFIALGGIMGAGTCGVGAALTPSFLWAKENAKGISEGITDGIKTSLKPKIGAVGSLEQGSHLKSVVRPMNEDEIQGVGCLVGLLGLGAVALATAPTEAVMLAAGGVGVPSSTPLLMMGMLGTLLPAGCSAGAAASLPLMALYQNFDSVAIGQKLASIVNWSSSPSVTLHSVTESKHESLEPSLLLKSEEPKLNVSMRTVPQESVVNVTPSSQNP